MTNDTLDRPVETVTDLVDFLLCSENDSFACTYLRGQAYHFNGRSVSLKQASFMLMLIRDDPEVHALLFKVCRANGLLPTVTLAQVVNKLVQIYQKNRHQDT